MADCIWGMCMDGSGSRREVSVYLLREEAAGIVLAAGRLVNQRKQFSKVKSVMCQKCQGD